MNLVYVSVWRPHYSNLAAGGGIPPCKPDVNIRNVIAIPPKLWNTKLFVMRFSNVAGEIAKHNHVTLQNLTSSPTFSNRVRSIYFVCDEKFGAKSGWNRVGSALAMAALVREPASLKRSIPLSWTSIMHCHPWLKARAVLEQIYQGGKGGRCFFRGADIALMPEDVG